MELPKLSIGYLNLQWDCLYEDIEDGLITEEEADKAVEEQADRLNKITDIAWCNGFEDSLCDYTPDVIFDALNAIGKEFGDYTCSIYFDVNGETKELQKDTLTNIDDLKQEYMDIVTFLADRRSLQL
jgi:hypothetical protein